jgi:hypothetical protein
MHFTNGKGKPKFQMTDWEGETGFARKHMNDTEHERTAVNKVERGYQGGFQNVPMPSQNQSFVQQMQNVNTSHVLESAIHDRMAQAEREMREDQKVLDLQQVDKDREGREDEDTVAKGDEDDELERLRAARRKKMMEGHKKKQDYLAKGHGDYEEIPEEDFLKTVTGSYRCVVHFYHQNFERSKILDKHLRKLVQSKKMLGTRFVKMDSEKAPFFVAKLKIMTLPTAVFFIDGVAKYKQIGFQGLPGGDEFKTCDLVRIMRENEAFEEDVDSEAEEFA